MTLIKSKINSLAWLKSAIYVFIIGGGTLSSSTPVLAATLLPVYDNETSVKFLVMQNPYGNGASRLYYNKPEYDWKGTIDIEQNNGFTSDELVIRVYLEHIHSPHQGDNASGRQLNLNFRSASSSPGSAEYDIDISDHPGKNHFDVAEGTLSVSKLANFISGIKVSTDITSWSLEVSATHNVPVPEPTTMFGTALALGWGGWMKRKNSIKQNETKSQG
jgi:hypothetical protein